MSQNKFEINANKGDKDLQILANTLGWAIEFPEDKYSVYDAKITTGNGNTYLVEHKNRQKLYQEMIMEGKKLTNMLDIVDSEGLDGVLYVNDIPNQDTLVWNITNELLERCDCSTLSAPLTTSGYQKKVDKVVWYLPVNTAMRVEKISETS